MGDLPTAVHLKCSHPSCGEPLTRWGQDNAGTEEWKCRNGHVKYFRPRYLLRFVLGLDKRKSLNVLPELCPGCRATLNRLAVLSKPDELVIVECGSCGTRLMYSESRNSWEDVPIN